MYLIPITVRSFIPMLVTLVLEELLTFNVLRSICIKRFH